MTRKRKVFVGMSGGVDSSVAALLLSRRGYHVVGVFMRCYNIDGCAERDAEDARRVAEHIGVPFYVWDFEEEYRRRVVDYMVEGYRAGETPNPDVECNREIKFGMFYERALRFGADYVATGHYVRRKRAVFRKQHNFLPARKFASPSARHPARAGTKLAGLRDVPQDGSLSPSFSLYMGKDKNKDQSYFLWTLTQKQLAHCLFPIGEYLKPEVREIARRAGLPTAEKKDSQGICFLGKVSVEDFLKQYLPARKGAIVTTEGKPVGEHEGSWFYTIGQRHGLNIGTRRHGPGAKRDFQPYYLVSKNVKANTVVVAEGEGHPALYKQDLGLRDINFLRPVSAADLQRGIKVMARVRYRQPLNEAVLSASGARGHGPGKACLAFARPQRFVAPGQSAVSYSRSGEMLGGGIIC